MLEVGVLTGVGVGVGVVVDVATYVLEVGVLTGVVVGVGVSGASRRSSESWAHNLIAGRSCHTPPDRRREAVSLRRGCWEVVQ